MTLGEAAHYYDLPKSTEQGASSRESTWGQWLEENMRQAVERVQAHEMTLGEAHHYYDLPKSTPKRRVFMQNKVANGGTEHLGCFKVKQLHTSLEKLITAPCASGSTVLKCTLRTSWSST